MVTRSLAALVVLVALFACKDPDPKCESVSGTIPSTMKLAGCSDGRSREVACSRTNPSDDWMCACKLDGSLGRTFNWPATHKAADGSDRRELEDLLSRQCHWSLRLH